MLDMGMELMGMGSWEWDCGNGTHGSGTHGNGTHGSGTHGNGNNTGSIGYMCMQTLGYPQCLIYSCSILEKSHWENIKMNQIFS